jgi:uncharacterized membrane protein
MLHMDGLLALIPLILTILAIYAFFSIAIDVRAIRRHLERQTAERDSRTP